MSIGDVLQTPNNTHIKLRTSKEGSSRAESLVQIDNFWKVLIPTSIKLGFRLVQNLKFCWVSRNIFSLLDRIRRIAPFITKKKREENASAKDGLRLDLKEDQQTSKVPLFSFRFAMSPPMISLIVWIYAKENANKGLTVRVLEFYR